MEITRYAGGRKLFTYDKTALTFDKSFLDQIDVSHMTGPALIPKQSPPAVSPTTIFLVWEKEITFSETRTAASDISKCRFSLTYSTMSRKLSGIVTIVYRDDTPDLTRQLTQPDVAWLKGKLTDADIALCVAESMKRGSS